MTPDPQPDNRAPRLLTVIEDGGLYALYQTSGTIPSAGDLTADVTVLQATRDVLANAIPKAYLDPFAPAAERDAEILRVLRQAIGEQLERGGPLANVPTDEATLLSLFDEVLGFGPAQKYLRDPQVQEIKINGTRILVQEDGSNSFQHVPERFKHPAHVLQRVQLLASVLGVKLDSANPQQTLPLGFGTRMHLTIPPCTPEGEALVCIRRGRDRPWVLNDILARRTITIDIAALLKLFCTAGCSFLIAGETGSGKTALLEALINSWPGRPHVLTIEDNTLEIVVKHPLWTRELVQTSFEPGAFGRAAKEALRQTPDLVAPGETRAEEAGAILSLGVSGHTVLTTIHAQSCLKAIQRFAKCAGMPGAYMYEGRREDALEDACAAFDVIIHIEKLGGRRYLREVALTDGVEEDAHGRVRPRLIPLVTMDVDQNGSVVWDVAANTRGETLVWHGEDQTPATLRQKLRLLRASGKVRAAATTQGTIEDAIGRADSAFAVGQGERALAILREAWADRRDERLLAAARRALSLDGQRLLQLQQQAQQIAALIEQALDQRQWVLAHSRLEEVLSVIDLAAAYAPPPAGWERFERQIAGGVERDTVARETTGKAQAALAQQRWRETADLLRGLQVNELAPDVALAALKTRERALEELVIAGATGSQVLTQVRAQIAGVEAQIARTASEHKETA